MGRLDFQQKQENGYDMEHIGPEPKDVHGEMATTTIMERMCAMVDFSKDVSS